MMAVKMLDVSDIRGDPLSRPFRLGWGWGSRKAFREGGF